MDNRKRLIELLRTAKYNLNGNTLGQCYFDSCLEMVVDHLLANGMTVQEWIPVTERLPEPGVRVLASDGAFVGEFYINKLQKWQRYNVNDYNLIMALDVLWWMPLPDPPKGE